MDIHDTKTCRGCRNRLGLSGLPHRISVVKFQVYIPPSSDSMWILHMG